MKEGQALKGHLDVLLLAALEQGPAHGYALKETLRQTSGGQFDLPTGTIYPALHRLERQHLVKSTWSVVEGRRRRTYQLTPTGKKRLARDRKASLRFATTLQTMLEPSS
ncbi:MAG TPA: helix-turn-helix transcriptional regulator [Acidimicrobiia bacterium]|nr:helix-turn-helix transcriptional regulator [Acidimicrobiia bacterium]